MSSIYFTGSSGFVGTNLQAYLKDKFQFSFYRRGEMAAINADIVIHLAGKAHDTKNVSLPEEYYKSNTELTKQIFDAFLLSSVRYSHSFFHPCMLFISCLRPCQRSSNRHER